MRPVVQLHTIEQWLSVDQGTRDLVMKNLKIRDRLWAFIMAKEQDHKMLPPAEGWTPCRRCDQRGWVYHHPRKQGIHPSALCHTCLLKVWYDAKGYQGAMVHDGRVLLIFSLGSAVHAMFQAWGLQGCWGPHYTPEVAIGQTPLAKELMLEGNCDADNILIIDEIPGAPIFEVGVIHEYKTINNTGFEALKNKPKPIHKQQATIYSACLNRPITVYMYLNKDNSNLVDFPVAYEPHLWETMKMKATVIRDALLQDKQPPADVGYHCNDCQFVFICDAYKAAKEAKTAKKG